MKYLWLLSLIAVSSVHADESPADTQAAIYLGENGVIVLQFQIQVRGKTPQQSFHQYVEDLMKSMDANQDGIVTVEEARGKYLNAREAAQAQLIPQTEVVGPDTTPDVSPADGKISRQELSTYFKRIGLQPFVMLYQPATPAANAPRQPRQGVATSETSPVRATRHEQRRKAFRSRIEFGTTNSAEAGSRRRRNDQCRGIEPHQQSICRTAATTGQCPRRLDQPVSGTGI